MKKVELVEKLAEKFETSKAEAGRCLDFVLDTIQAEMAAGNEVKFPGFGKFTVADRAARTGRNPQTGEAIQIPAKKAPKFTALKGLKEAVNG